MTDRDPRREKKARRWVSERLREYFAWQLAQCETGAEALLDGALSRFQMEGRTVLKAD